MKHTFLITTATAALLAGTGLASAQGSYGQAPAASEQKAAPELDKSKSEINKSKGNEQKSNMGAQNKADQKPAVNAQAPDKAAGSNAAGSKSETSGQAAPAKSEDLKAQDTQKPDSKAQGMQKQDSAAPQNAQSKSGSDSKGTAVQGEAKSGTASSGAASANVTLNAEQKTKIRETVIKAPNAPRVASVNFSLSIGTAVPKTVRFAPLPVTLIEIHPAWRGYEYFLVGDEIVVVDPRTMQIVAILQV